MPPRIPTNPSASSASALVRNSFASPCTSQSLPGGRAGFSTTPIRERSTNLRRAFLEWTRKVASHYRRPNSEGPSYLINGRPSPASRNRLRPFPLNRNFQSESVLNDQARELIWGKVMRKGESLKAVSAELGVDLTRVAAVVRLKEVEKDWVSKVRLACLQPTPSYTALLP